ncbi:TPA: hypothetical protein H1005_01590 [archaeon]|uniref:Uncharacterized protein n=1 Tax=Candidatus Naiadarchaeum limnaeum TaxID=2756139 RepID=A0A832XJ69_9ARCH|nr:hypothetical protein [Candidatus Naiadarchaeales archaeon SRR2090153.bin1042]HIK00172.1 hypothetical protein [Candidatus Naiadarchaeum limnaeum]
MVKFIDGGNVIEIVPENLKIVILFRIIAEEAFLMAVRKKLQELRREKPKDAFGIVFFMENRTAIERLRAIRDGQKEILETMLEMIAREILRHNLREIRRMTDVTEEVLLWFNYAVGFKCGVEIRGELVIEERRPLRRRYFFDKKKFESVQGESSTAELIKRIKFRLG